MAGTPYKRQWRNKKMTLSSHTKSSHCQFYRLILHLLFVLLHVWGSGVVWWQAGLRPCHAPDIKPLPHRHHLSHQRYQHVHRSITHRWFPQCCSVTFRQRQLSQSKGEMKKVRKRFPSFNLQISHSHHDFFCTFRKLFIFDAHVKLLQNQPPPD